MSTNLSRLKSSRLTVVKGAPGAAARAAKALGYRKIITYTLDTEPGTSLRAAGWACAGLAGGERWTGQRRPAVDLYPPQKKLRYEKEL